MVAAIRIRQGMDEISFQGHIAYSAGVAKSNVTMLGATTIIDVLVNSGLLENIEGKISIREGVGAYSIEQHTQKGDEGRPNVDVPFRRGLLVEPLSPTPRAARFNFDIRLNITVAELEGLAEKLSGFLRDFTAAEADEHSSNKVLSSTDDAE